jgi:hypothetical protein
VVEAAALRASRFGGQPSPAIAGLASRSRVAAKAGGASRDRTDDLKLAKLALSQLSYGPDLAEGDESHATWRRNRDEPSVGGPSRS